ncbi:Lanosterol alpha-demethylase [Salix suchowensis]|nr:Lanosterol alpha-demethylase [Salix suchowensis]
MSKEDQRTSRVGRKSCSGVSRRDGESKGEWTHSTTPLCLELEEEFGNIHCTIQLPKREGNSGYDGLYVRHDKCCLWKQCSWLCLDTYEIASGDEQRLVASLRFAEGASVVPLSPPPPGKVSDPLGEITYNFTHPAANKYQPESNTRIEEQRAKLSARVTKRPISLEKARYHADEELFAEDADPSTSTVFAPGTFIETRRWRIVMLVSSGDVWTPLRDDVMFAVADFVPNDLISRCGGNEVAGNHSELMARVKVLQRLHQVDKAVEDAYNKIQRAARSLYSRTRSSDPHAWSTVNLADAAKIISPNPDLVHTFAVHKFLMKQSLQYVADPDYRVARTFHVRPQAHVDIINAVTAMTRQGDAPSNPLVEFVPKARELIARHQQIRRSTRDESPSIVPTKVKWAPADRQILTFLLHSLRPKRSTQIDPYHVGTFAILKRLHTNIQEIHESIVHQTLVDLGVIAPWQDAASLVGKVDQSPKKQKLLETQEKAIIDKAFSSPSPRQTASAPVPLGSEDFHLQDPLHSIRHDFGDLPVFVIDDVTAEELDDGISVESIPTEPGSHWVHVHIADPASLLPVKHVFSEAAKKLGSSSYMINAPQSMLPRALMSHGLSLGSALQRGEPQRVISFSGKIDADGDIVDYKVRAGIINNVKAVDYDSVNAALSLPTIQRLTPFEGQNSSKPHRSLAAEDSKQLMVCNDVVQRLLARRRREASFNVSAMGSEIYLRQRGAPETLINLKHVAVFRGFPDLRYTVFDPASEDAGSRQMVAEMMKVACRVASRFSQDRGLPLLRRTAPPAILPNPSDLQDLLQLRTPNGFVPFVEVLKKGVMLGTASYSVEPLGHWGIGVPDGEGYCRVTSPLRRYSDLVAHWQIHSALLSTSPTFSTDWLKNYGDALVWQDRARKKRQQLHDDFWKYLYIRHQIESQSPEARAVLDNLTGEVISNGALNTMSMHFQCQVAIPKLGISADLRNMEEDQVPQIGSIVPVRVEEIKLGSRPQLDFGLIS